MVSNRQISIAVGVLTITYILYSSYYITEGMGLSNKIVSVTLGIYQFIMLLYFVKSLAESISITEVNN